MRWLLLVSATLSSTALHFAGPEVRYLVDGIERGIGGTETVLAATAGPWQHFYVFDGSTAPTTIQFQARDQMAMTTTVGDLRAFVVPLPGDTDALYAAVDGPVQATSMTSVPIATLTVKLNVPAASATPATMWSATACMCRSGKGRPIAA